MEQAYEALKINSSGKSSGRNVVKRSNDIIDGERNVNMLLKDTNAKEEEDLEKAIEKNVLSSADSAIKSLETAGMAIAKANKNNKESSGGGVFRDGDIELFCFTRVAEESGWFARISRIFVDFDSHAMNNHL